MGYLGFQRWTIGGYKCGIQGFKDVLLGVIVVGYWELQRWAVSGLKDRLLGNLKAVS